MLNASPSTTAAATALTGPAPDGMLALCVYGSEPLAPPTMPMVTNRPRAMADPAGAFE